MISRAVTFAYFLFERVNFVGLGYDNILGYSYLVHSSFCEKENKMQVCKCTNLHLRKINVKMM